MANKPIATGSGQTGKTQPKQQKGSADVPGTSVSWHVIVLWFLGAMAMLALASPAPRIATMIMVILIFATLLKNWPVYKSYLGA